LAARAIDTMNETAARLDVCNALLKYLDTDTIWYVSAHFNISACPFNTRWVSFHQDYPEPLVRLQNEHWNPLITWARDTFDIEILTSDSVLFSAQPEATKKKLNNVLRNFDPWQMAGCVSFI
jgi:ATP synthase mitochondrial F1 complex assembly factor 2